MRFTLSKLFLAVALAALACAGMSNRARWWADTILSLTIFLYVAVALLAVVQSGPSRRFRVAFSVVGSGYLLLTVCTLFSPIGDSMVTNIPLALVAKWSNIQTAPITIIPPTAAPPISGVPGGIGNGTTTVNSGTFSLSGVAVTSGTLTLQQVNFGELDLDSFVTAGVHGGRAIQIGAFFIIGHCVWSWLFALLAAWFVSIASARGTPQKA